MVCLAKNFSTLPECVAPCWGFKLRKQRMSAAAERRPEPACLPEHLLSSVYLRTILWGACYTQLFLLCLICPFAIPRPLNPSLAPSFIVPPSWAPFYPLSIRSITELWLSHFNITSGCKTKGLISLLNRERIVEIHFPSLQHPHSITRCGPARCHRGVVL